MCMCVHAECADGGGGEGCFKNVQENVNSVYLWVRIILFSTLLNVFTFELLE